MTTQSQSTTLEAIPDEACVRLPPSIKVVDHLIDIDSGLEPLDSALPPLHESLPGSSTRKGSPLYSAGNNIIPAMSASLLRALQNSGADPDSLGEAPLPDEGDEINGDEVDDDPFFCKGIY